MNRITIFAWQLDGYTGYGRFTCDLIEELTRRGIHVSVRAQRVVNAFGCQLSDTILTRLVKSTQPEEWEVAIGPPEMLPTPGKRTFFWTMHESTKLNDFQRRNLASAQRVAVACNANLYPLNADYVLPLGLKTHLFPKREAPFFHRFGAAGYVGKENSERKNLRMVAEAFIEAVGSREDCVLWIKTDPDNQEEMPNHPRVFVKRERMTDGQVRAFLSALRYFVSGSFAEGFGFWNIQAMLVGCPVIGVPWFGQEDYIFDKNGYPITVTETRPAGLDYGGEWPAIRTEHLVGGIKKAVEDEDYKNRSSRAVATAKRYSIENCADRAIDVWRRLGILQKESWFKAWKTQRKVKPNKSLIVHVYSMSDDSVSEEQRMMLAASTWPSTWKDCMAKIGELERHYVDDERKLPFVRDVIELARDDDPNTIVVLTNADTCMVENIDSLVRARIEGQDVFYSHRRDFPIVDKPMKQDQILAGEVYPGVDMFVFRWGWWEKVRDRYPDLLYGAEEWDRCLAVLARESKAKAFDDMIYHGKHQSHWFANRWRISSQRYNHTVAALFLAQHGIGSEIPEQEEEAFNLI